jgi:hypothetical protein
MKWLLRTAIILGAIFIGSLSNPVEAHHDSDGILPLAPYTAVIKNFWRTGVITWCVDSRAQNYPGFVAAVHETNDADYFRTRIPHRQVAWSNDGNQCNVRHTMPDETMEAGVAGTILYTNWPVTIKYNWRLGFSGPNWKTTIGHEGTNCGHNVGEHEGYDDVKFLSHYRTYGYWASPWRAPTVMDFGTGVWECTPADVALIHSILLPRAVLNGGELRRHPDGTPYVFYCGGDVGRADRIQLMVSDPEGVYHFTGVSKPVSAGCVGELVVDGPPGYCFYWSSEVSAWTESWSEGNLRNDTFAGCL